MALGWRQSGKLSNWRGKFNAKQPVECKTSIPLNPQYPVAGFGGEEGAGAFGDRYFAVPFPRGGAVPACGAVAEGEFHTNGGEDGVGDSVLVGVEAFAFRAGVRFVRVGVGYVDDALIAVLRANGFGE